MFITNKNYYDVKDEMIVYNKYVTDNVVNVYRNGEEIVIVTDRAVSPCWYYIKRDNDFILTDDIGTIERFCDEQGVHTTPNNLAIDYYALNHKSGARTYKREYRYIEDFREIHLKPNGDYTVVPFGFKSFYKEPKDSYDQIKELLLKYKKIIGNMVDDDVFRPTLTGGLDSRTLIGLYRDYLPQIKDYYLLGVKKDGHNHVEKGEAEIELSHEVFNYLGYDPERVETLDGKVTVSSHLNENQSYKRCQFVTSYEKFWANKVVSHYKNTDEFIRWLTDPLYLELKVPCHNFYKSLFALLLIPDLLDIRLISFSSEFYNGGSYSFYRKNCDAICEAKKVMDYWGKANCQNILDL